VPARAQRSLELAAGWDFMSKAVYGDANAANPYLAFRASAGEALAPHFRLRLDADAMLVDFRQRVNQPCGPIGCDSPSLNHLTRRVYGVSANGLVDLESTGTLYALGGAGLYDAFTTRQTVQMALSGGLGMTLATAPGYRVVLETTGHFFGSKGAAPSWMVPVSLALRF
jgi:hypothetical protein